MEGFVSEIENFLYPKFPIVLFLNFFDILKQIDGWNKFKQDKYTMDPVQSSLSQQKEKKFWSKMFFEQKQVRKMHISCIIND